MSDNKFRYYQIDSTTIVKANNKSEAEAVSRGRRGVPGTTLATEVVVEQLTANEARELADEMV